MCPGCRFKKGMADEVAYMAGAPSSGGNSSAYMGASSQRESISSGRNIAYTSK